MRISLSVSLPNKLVHELARLAKSENMSRSEIIKLALRDFLIDKQIQCLREKLVPHAHEKGIFTDEDVFRSFGS
ncbi:MAG: CopG family transcriptional regulator [Candidatus Omnitrophica bacterium]|nr:CopG family transcriptional regulator [Candidatus Omnitrophota bacterium]